MTKGSVARHSLKTRQAQLNTEKAKLITLKELSLSNYPRLPYPSAAFKKVKREGAGRPRKNKV